MMMVINQVEPQLTLALVLDARSHQLEHELLPGNVEAIWTKAFDKPAIFINTIIWTFRHLIDIRIHIVQTSIDILVVPRKRVLQANLDKSIDLEGLKFFSLVHTVVVI